MIALLACCVPAGRETGQADMRWAAAAGAHHWRHRLRRREPYQISNLTCFSGRVFVKNEAPIVDSCA